MPKSFDFMKRDVIEVMIGSKACVSISDAVNVLQNNALWICDLALRQTFYAILNAEWFWTFDKILKLGALHWCLYV